MLYWIPITWCLSPVSLLQPEQYTETFLRKKRACKLVDDLIVFFFLSSSRHEHGLPLRTVLDDEARPDGVHHADSPEDSALGLLEHRKQDT
jgi:hypothetical protein